MKTTRFLFAAALSVLAFTSCSSDDDFKPSGDGNSPQFTSTITDHKTKAAGAVWHANDAIGIYMLKSGMGLTSDAAHAENMHYKTEEGTANGLFVAAGTNHIINYPDDGSAVDFIAYYPYKSGLTDYTYPIDVTDQTSQPAIDFLYSNNAVGLTKNTPNVNLGFKHKLTKLVFNITSESVSDLSGLQVSIKGSKTKASYNLAGGTDALTIDDSSVADIVAKVSESGALGEAIIIPVNSGSGITLVFTLTSGSSYSWEVSADTNYEEGKKFTYFVKLGEGGDGSVTINPEDTQIEDWTESPSEIINPEKDENQGPPAPEGDVELDKLYGYAEGTTGGEGGTVHHFDTGTKFRDWLKLREKNKSTDPAVVWLSGTFTKDDGRATSSPWFDIKRTSNISIYGTHDFKMQNVGFFLNEAENIIIRNVYIVMPKADNGADGISMQKSNRVWVDHCTFESVNQTKDYEDGSCDITHGTKNVTVSWNHFIKTQKSSLVGHSNSETGDTQITVTYHHNFFDQSSSRHPRVRFGKAHVYNNFFNQVTTYGVGSAYGAMVLVENNYFDGVHLPTDICTYPAKSSGSNLQGSVAGYLFAADNEYTNKPANASDPYPFTNLQYLAYNGSTLSTSFTRADFTPGYTYIVDKTENINSIVPAGAGVGKLSNYATAPISVNNGNMPDTGETDPEEEIDDIIDLGGGWSATNLGADNAGGVNSISESSISMAGKGKFESGKQTFNFVYKEITGDFEITAYLESFTVASTSNQAEAGLMFLADPATSGTDLLFALCGKGGDKKFNYGHRLEASTNASRGGLTGTSATEGGAYLKLRRVGNSYFASYSLDGGETYSAEKSYTFTGTGLPDKLYVGLAVNGGSNTDAGTAKFSDIRINGTLMSFEN
ncbi:MAG: fimbrillin family protein [Dysgonomonas sp.]|nr:fimbrillin family protein [Dysgonomonas sp.]